MSLPRQREPGDRTTLWCGVVAVPSAVSIGVAVIHGLHRGIDFQWSGAHMLAKCIDPYKVSLQHDPGHLILMNQIPNYLHEFYVLLLPLGMMPFSMARGFWVATNLVVAVTCVLLLGRTYGLTREQTWLLGLLLGASTPFRISVSSGQHALLETLLLLLVTTSAAGGFALGGSYFKYSFSPVVVCYMAMRGRWKLLAQSAVLPLIGLAIFWLMVRGNIVQEAMEPFAVNRAHGVATGAGDLMSSLYLYRLHHGLSAVSSTGAIPAAVGSFVLGAIVAVRRSSDFDALPALICASLLLFVHLSYDHLALVVPLAALLRSTHEQAYAMNRGRQLLAGAGIGMLWFVMPSIGRVLPSSQADNIEYLSLGFLLLCFGCMLPKVAPLTSADLKSEEDRLFADGLPERG